MSLGEFKAWLTGYLESCSASPAKRVKRIEEKLAEVSERSPYPTYVPWYTPQWTWTSPIITTGDIAIDTPTWTVSNDTICSGNMTIDTICSGNMTIGYLNTGVE